MVTVIKFVVSLVFLFSSLQKIRETGDIEVVLKLNFYNLLQ